MTKSKRYYNFTTGVECFFEGIFILLCLLSPLVKTLTVMCEIKAVFPQGHGTIAL